MAKSWKDGDQGEYDPNAPEYSVEESPLEVEPTRRAASAEFVVDSDVGSAAALREAMDPANRSLTDALQMSFRVLQLVIIVLLVLFLFSGFKTVGASQAGVATVWGRIIDRDGLEPGLQMNWPPPIGEFVLFEAEGRLVDDNRAFLSQDLRDQGMQVALQSSGSQDLLDPIRDGSVLTDGGELAHIQIAAKYRIASPATFLSTLADAEADSIVRVALERAVVHVSASNTLRNLQDDLSNEEIEEMIIDSAQTVLDDINSGMKISEVSVMSELIPPIRILKKQEEFSQSRQRAAEKIERANKFAQESLIGVAGKSYPELAKLVMEYEEAWVLDSPDLDQRLSDINSFFEGEEIAGLAARTISTAQRFQSRVDQGLGREARRFAGLLPSYREHPDLVIAEKWLEAYASVMGQPDVEIMYVPEGLGSMGLDITGLESVRDIRRRADIEAREKSVNLLGGTSSDYMMRASEINIGKAGRQLKIDESTGTVTGMRQELLNRGQN